jgi:hypothetical protein
MEYVDVSCLKNKYLELILIPLIILCFIIQEELKIKKFYKLVIQFLQQNFTKGTIKNTFVTNENIKIKALTIIHNDNIAINLQLIIW